MLSEDEVTQAIKECEKSVRSYTDCEKLATFYAIYDHLYGDGVGEVKEVIGEYGDSDFLRGIAGKSARDAWLLMDELMATLSLLTPRLYEGILNKL